MAERRVETRRCYAGILASSGSKVGRAGYLGFLDRILLAGEGIGVAMIGQGVLPLVMLLAHPPQAFLAGVPEGRSALDHG